MDWLAERFLGDWLDRSRLKVSAVQDQHGRGFGFLCSNQGRTATSVNGVGYWTSDGDERDLPTKDELPATIQPHGEVVIHPVPFRLASDAYELREQGRAIRGFWVRKIGMKMVPVKIDPQILAVINNSPRPRLVY